MDRIRIKPFVVVVVSLVLAVMLAACGGGDRPASFADQNVTLKVMYYEEAQFFRDYGELLFAKYPNLEIEVASTNSIYPANPGPDFNYEEAFATFIEERNPDLLMLSEYQYQEFYEEGRLINLEPKIEADQYDIESIAPGVIEMLRERAGGQLHGLAPRFNNQALYYNPALFDQYGIPHPTDHMTWEEVFDLARQFPTGGASDERIYGISFEDHMRPVYLLQNIAHTEGLAFADPVTRQMTIQNENWDRLLRMLADLYRSDALPAPKTPEEMFMGGTYEEYLLSNLFVAGRSAMTVNSPYLMDMLRQAADRLPDRAVDYALVTAPVDSANRERGGSINVYNIFAIHATSEAQDAAWEVLKYLNSDEMARIKSRSTMDLLSRTGYAERGGVNLEAFYKLIPPNAPTVYEEFGDLPNFFGGFQMLLEQELDALIEGTKTVEEVLDTLHNEGQKLLMAENPGE